VMSAYESLPGTAVVIKRPDSAGTAGEESKLLTRRRRATLSGQDAHSLRARQGGEGPPDTGGPPTPF
jgi:hypothetical protein